MEKIQKFLLNESVPHVTDEDDLDMQEKEIREVSGEGGPASGGMGDDNVEPASPDVIEEDEERQAKLVLGKQDTSLYGMTKTEARELLKNKGYSDTHIKDFERQKETHINNILKEDGMEFPGAQHDPQLDNNMFDGSFFGADKENLGDLQHGFDPNNPDMAPLNQTVKPYESEFNASPQSVMAHGPKGYHNSIPSYDNRSAGFAEESYLPPGSAEGRASDYNPEYPKKNLPPSHMTPEGEKGYHDSVDLPEESDNLDHGLKADLAKKDKDYETNEPGKEDREESLKDSIDMVKLIKRAVAKGYSKAAIKEMIAVMKEDGEKWMQKATDKMKKKGTEGSETKAAHAAGESPMEFAHQHYHDKGKTGQKARFAVNAQKRD